jgi:GNAT superfamily N-acetyltransferase
MRFARSDCIMRFRVAAEADAMAVATLHAESWRAHYRGAYRDEYLDGEVVQDRIRVWKERLSTPAPNQFVVLAEGEDDLIGFACAYGGHDETWGSLLDNIHVRPEHQRRGIGAALLAEVAGGGWGGLSREQRRLRSLPLGAAAEPPGTAFLPTPRR